MQSVLTQLLRSFLAQLWGFHCAQRMLPGFEHKAASYNMGGVHVPGIQKIQKGGGSKKRGGFFFVRISGSRVLLQKMDV